MRLCTLYCKRLLSILEEYLREKLSPNFCHKIKKIPQKLSEEALHKYTMRNCRIRTLKKDLPYNIYFVLFKTFYLNFLEEERGLSYRGIQEKGSGYVVLTVCYTIYTIYLSLCTQTAETTSLELFSESPLYHTRTYTTL